MPLKEVFHIGDLENLRASSSRKAGHSYEGNCLSVSVHPTVWSRIARLGGELYRLSHDNPKWCDAYSKKNRKEALKWTISKGLLKPAKIYRLWTTDEEGEERYSTFDSKTAALEEAGVEDEADLESEGFHKIDSVKGAVLTELSRGYWKRGCAPQGDCSEWAVVWWAEAHGYDGIWWEEDLDPAAFSAPRGGIFQSKIKSWKLSKPMDEQE